jgi:FMN phosphatase YigB (HAD superfamily)
VKQAEPEPDLFLAAAKKLKMDLDHCVVIGDSVGFACRPASPCSRHRFIGGRIWRGRIGARAGAYRVYLDPEDLLKHLDEIGV